MVFLLAEVLRYSARPTNSFHFFSGVMFNRMAVISMKYRAEYFALRGFSALVRCLPRQAALTLGRRVGRLLPRVMRSRYRLAVENMRMALPELSPSEIEENVYKNFEHISICSVEMLRLDMLKPGENDIDRYFELSDLHHLEDAIALQKGVIVLTAHLGFWEVGQFVFPELGIPFDVVAKPLKNPLSDRFVENIRTSFGSGVLNSRKGARRILKSLQEQHVVGILLDQHISPPGSVVTEFFGRKAYTTSAITTLAMKYQIPIVPLFCLRQEDNRYKIWAEEMLLLSNAGENALVENTQKLTDIIEVAIRKDVTQWFWMHRRWRVKPDKQRDENT